MLFSAFPLTQSVPGCLYGWAAARQGRQDGQRLIPDDAAPDPPPYVSVLLHRSQERIRRLVRAWQWDDARHQTRHAAAAHALAPLRRDERLAAARAAAARQAWAEAADRARAEHERLNPPGSWYCPAAWYRVAVVLLALGDLPLTFMAFQVFRLAPLYTGLLALVVVAMLVALGHFLGVFARRLRWGDAPLMAVTLVLSALFVGSLTLLREEAAALVAAGADAPLDPLAAGLAFLAVTAVGIFLPALLARHTREEPLGPLVAGARREWRRASRILAGARRAWSRAHRAARAAAARRQAAWAALQEEVGAEAERAVAAMHVYAMANVRAREGHRLPPALQAGALPRPEVPAAAAAPLQWDPPPAVLRDEDETEGEPSCRFKL